MEEEDLHTLLKNGFQDHMPVDSSNKGNQSITEFGNYAGSALVGFYGVQKTTNKYPSPEPES